MLLQLYLIVGHGSHDCFHDERTGRSCASMYGCCPLRAHEGRRGCLCRQLESGEFVKFSNLNRTERAGMSHFNASPKRVERVFALTSPLERQGHATWQGTSPLITRCRGRRNVDGAGTHRACRAAGRRCSAWPGHMCSAGSRESLEDFSWPCIFSRSALPTHLHTIEDLSMFC
jgi:hypothetical protein